MLKSPLLQSVQPCPFCSIPFKRLGNHLRHCPERNGQDYTSYLAQKTLDRRQKHGPSRQQCHKCGRWWKRLDTHLRLSAGCRLVVQESGSVSTITSQEQAPGASHGPDPLVLPSAESPLSPSMLRPFNCPCSEEEWADANQHFASMVVPAVLSATTVDEKNQVLCEGIYSYFSGRYGTRAKKSRSSRKRRGGSQSPSIAQLRAERNRLRNKLRRAKKNGQDMEAIKSLETEFHRLL